jgi:hypothetical protein
MSRTRLIALLMAFTAAGVSMARGGIVDELDAAQLKELNGGGHVVVQQTVDGAPWPRIKIYARVKASAEEVAAVFFDYAQAKTYIPNVLESRISKQVSPTSFEVYYEVEVPILPDEQYTALNQLQRLDDHGYEISWRLLKSLQVKSAVGSLRVEPGGDGGAVICYTNFVTPDSVMATLLRSMALSRMESTVYAIVQEVERQKTQHADVLAKEVSALRAALAERQ